MKVAPLPVSTLAKAKQRPEAGSRVASAPSRISKDAKLVELVDANYTATCTQWSYVANNINSFVTGNCEPGAVFNSEQRTWNGVDNGNGVYYYWNSGKVGGAFNGCGWVRHDRTAYANSNTQTNCGRDYLLQLCVFMDCPGGTPSIYGSASDGLWTQVKRPCFILANIRPWASNQTPTGGFGNSATQVKVRYVARYPVGGKMYFMVHDVSADGNPNRPNWGFMPIECFY